MDKKFKIGDKVVCLGGDYRITKKGWQGIVSFVYDDYFSAKTTKIVSSEDSIGLKWTELHMYNFNKVNKQKSIIKILCDAHIVKKK